MAHNLKDEDFVCSVCSENIPHEIIDNNFFEIGSVNKVETSLRKGSSEVENKRAYKFWCEKCL